MKMESKIFGAMLLLTIVYGQLVVSGYVSPKNNSAQGYQMVPGYQESSYDKVIETMHPKIETPVDPLRTMQVQPPIAFIDNTTPTVSMVSRIEALEKMTEITTQMFDPKEQDHISVYLNKMLDLAEHLDEELDKKTINAIHFLLNNQHKTSYIHIPYWSKAAKENELETAIPMTPEIAALPSTTKASALRQKMLNTPPADAKVKIQDQPDENQPDDQD